MVRAALKYQVAKGLRVLREEAGVSREEAAAVIRASVPTVGHIETGRSLPSGLQLEKLLAHYGRTDRVPTFLDLRERARSEHDWWTDLPIDLPTHRALFLGSESVADRIESWDPARVPDLAQTPDYTRALIRATDPTCPPEEIDQRLTLLAARQRAVLDEHDPALLLMIGESALRWPVGSSAVAKAQVARLKQLAERPRTEVWLLPIDGARRPLDGGPFTILSFPDLGAGDEPSAVYTETLVSGYYYDDPAEVAAYRALLTHLKVTAIEPAGLHVFLRRLGY